MPDNFDRVITYATIYLDETSKNNPAFIYAKQYDTARYINVKLMNASGQFRIESGCQLNIVKSNGDTSFILGVVDTDDGTATFKLTSQALSTDGIATCDISLFDADDDTQLILTSSTFYLSVEKSQYDEDAVESEDEYSGVAEVLSQIGEVIDAAKDAEAWAVGEREGSPVPSTDETYHNNAKYYAELLAEQAAVVEPFTGATDSTAGRMGLVPAPSAGDNHKYLCGDGTWKTVQGGGGADFPVTTRLIKGNGSGGAVAATPGTDYVIQSQVPSDTADLTNGAGFQTYAQVEAAIAAQVPQSITVISDTNGDVVLGL